MDKIPLLSLNRGRAQTSFFKGKEAKSAIFKEPADRALELGYEGIEGDEQADRVHHGGPDKAVCVYSLVNYPHWEQVLGRQLPFGAFGENFTIGSSTEEDVCIGDVFRVGTAVVQISQPRVPCWKLAMKWGLDGLPKLVADSGATGYYYRVLEPGSVRAGDVLVHDKRHFAGVTVAEVNRILHRNKQDIAGIEQLLRLDDVLARVLLDMLESRLARLKTGE
ncbi:MOSC domain-containing protein [Cohnella pontilimi]|uniref:MOSC domain-containing protein n=1 Tax=Cohnella pontilimi TaxID=2564100 RepID=A0A4U0FJC3_9BACL|nr:MOSC domain-containing protein [Cohnella pontilimi]